MNDWAYRGRPFHTHHLLPLNLFTCKMIQTGDFKEFHLFETCWWDKNIKYTTRSHSKLIKYGCSVSGLKGPSVRQFLRDRVSFRTCKILKLWVVGRPTHKNYLTNLTFKGAIGKNCPRFFKKRNRVQNFTSVTSNCCKLFSSVSHAASSFDRELVAQQRCRCFTPLAQEL